MQREFKPVALAAIIYGWSAVVPAQESPAPASERAGGGLEEIVVTAQKRAESISTVPMSITALSGDALAERNITTSEDLVRVVPGFQAATTATGVPVYSIRGIGFNDTSTAARPTVSVYQDEVPYPFSVQTKAASMDIEHVEILKGPQGTLFGSNSTGGAINYIAAKPTDTFDLGANLSYGNFNAVQFDGFLSGPLASNVNSRLAVQHSRSDDWQQSLRRGDENGERDFTAVRFLTDWNATDALKVGVNLNAWWDKSDSQAPQVYAFRPSDPRYANRIPETYQDEPVLRDNRSADWTPGVDYARNDTFYQGTVRVDYEFGGGLELTSLTSYLDYSSEYFQDADGSEYLFFQFGPESDMETFSQELRLAGRATDRIRFLAGVNFQFDDVSLNLDERLNSTASYSFTPLGLPQFTHVAVPVELETDAYAAFTSFDFNLTEALTLNVGVRYTDTTTDFAGCTEDGGDGAYATGYTAIVNMRRAAVGLPPTSFGPGECGTMIAETRDVGVMVTDTLEETNTSWRTGLDWQLSDQAMLYANVSKGFKSGSYPLLGSTVDLQYEPAVQESVVAYEAGVKTTLANQLQLTGALFYLDYSDKQIFGRRIDPVFGSQKKLVNVPESEVLGAEAQFVWQPASGLTVSGGLSWLDTEFTSDYETPTILGGITNVQGQPFPFTPEWQGNIDVEYEWSLQSGWRPLIGVSAYAQSSTNAELGELPETEVDSYTLLDMRAGVRSADAKWTVLLWGRNLTDEYYWNNATLYHDTVVRFTGMPRTYGVRVSYSMD